MTEITNLRSMALAQLIEDTIEQWKSKKRSDAPPFRYEFNDLDQNMQFLLSYNASTGHKIRCSGLFFDGLIGSSVVGRSIASLFKSEDQNHVNDSVNRVFTGPAMVTLEIQTTDKPIELVLLPIRAEHGPIEYAFGAVNLESMPEFASPKISLIKSNVKELRDAPSSFAVGFAEGKSSFSHKSAPSFKVIDGNNLAKGRIKKSVLKIIHSFKREP